MKALQPPMACQACSLLVLQVNLAAAKADFELYIHIRVDSNKALTIVGHMSGYKHQWKILGTTEQ